MGIKHGDRAWFWGSQIEGKEKIEDGLKNKEGEKEERKGRITGKTDNTRR